MQEFVVMQLSTYSIIKSYCFNKTSQHDSKILKYMNSETT